MEKSISPAQQLIEENLSTGKDFLDLGNCGLTNSSPELDYLRNCQHLKSLSLGIENFNKQNKLVNTDNSGATNYFSTIPLILCDSLEELQIRNAGIKSIDNIATLVKLKLLDLSLNSITKIENLQTLSNLEELALHGNQIDKIEKLDALNKLKILHLTRNKISKIENLKGLDMLQELYLSANLINNIENLESLSALTYLDLNNNKITWIQNLKDLVNLNTLWLHKNQISKLEGLHNLTKLESLDVSDNKITVIENIAQLTNLKSFFISNNYITKIRPLTELNNLQYFSITGNKIDDCPSDLWQTADMQQVRSYFEKDLNVERDAVIKKTADSGNEEIFTRDVKLILLGNSNTGKTNLVHYLQTGEFLQERVSTHGLEVKRWIPDEKRFPLLKNIHVSIWDFGGQEYYHEAYRLFLTANAVYVVLWEKDFDKNINKITRIDNTKELELQHFEKRYWLDTVRFYGTNKEEAPLLLVQNKADNQEKDKLRISQDLYEEYQLYECYHISLKEGVNDNNQQQAMILQLFDKELEMVLLKAADRAEIPPSYQLIRKEVLAWQENPENTRNFFDSSIKEDAWMKMEDFISVCRKIAPVELTNKDIYTLPRWLDKTCAIVFFENNDALRNKVFLSPKKLSEKIYQVLNKDILHNKGEFSKNEFMGTDEFKETFLEATKSLGLIFDHPLKKDFFLAPQYLPAEHAIEDLFQIASVNAWQDSFWVKVPLFYYKNLLSDLILTYIGGKQITARYFWKHGIVFIKNNLRVIIKGLYPDKEQTEGLLLVGVENGPGRNEILKEIFTTIFTYEKRHNRAEAAKEIAQKESGSATIREIKSVPSAEGKFLQNLRLSYDNLSYEYYSHLIVLNDAKEPFFINSETNARLSLYRFAPILPFSVDSRPPKKIFVSYSHQNTSWLNKLRVHLSGLKHSNIIEDWTDQEIFAGERWDTKIKENMEKADVFICLLSADFIASDYIWNTELKSVFEKIKSRNAKVIFIYVEPFDLGSIRGASISDDLKETSILDFEIIPKNSGGHLQPLALWINENEGLSAIVKKIREAITT